MKKLDQRGALNVLLIPLILVILFFIGAAAFGYWAFNQRQDYKNNSDQKVAAGQAVTKQQTQAADAKQYAEEAKNPLKSYVGPSAFGAITVQYPKTWGAYVVENATGDPAVDGYFQPNFVPNTDDQDNSYSLRVQLTQQSYNQVLQQYASQVSAGQATVAPYKFPKVPSVVGSIVKGQINSTKQGTMVIVPLRNMTLKVWTESSAGQADFDKYILPNFSFSP